MANSLATKITVSSGRTKVLDTYTPSSVTISSLVVSGDIALDWEIYLDRDIGSTAIPAAPTLASSAGGTFMKKATLSVRVTAIDVDGKESPPGSAAVLTFNQDNYKATATPPSVTGAVSFNVYAGTQSGMETYQGNVIAGSSFIILDPPQNQALAIPTLTDLTLLAQPGVAAIPMGGVAVSLRIVVYANAITSGKAAVSIIVT